MRLSPPVDIPTPAATTRDRYVRRICLIGLILLFGYFLGYVNIRFLNSRPHFGDFETFYRASQAVLEHSDPYLAGKNELAYVYPPLIAFLYAPLAHYSLLAAARIMLPINLFCVIASLFVAATQIMERFEVRITPARLLAVCLMTGLLSENELRGQLQAMETDVLMLLAFTLGLAWLDRRPSWAGIVLGFAMNIKYLSIVALPYLLLRRRWRAAGGLVAGSVAFALLPALLLGWDENLRCLRVALSGLLGWVGVSTSGTETARVHNVADGLSVSVTSAIARMMRGHHISQAMALLAAAGIGLICLGAAAWAYRRMRLPFLRWPAAPDQGKQPFAGLVGVEWVILVGLMLAFSPDTNTRHLVLALLLNVAASVLLLIPRKGVAVWPLWVGVAMMFFGFIMPLKVICPDWFRHEYFKYGAASWGLLVLCGTLLWTALGSINAARDGVEPVNLWDPSNSRSPAGFPVYFPGRGP